MAAERIYNFERFGAHDNTAPQQAPQKKDNIVSLPRQELQKSARKRALPLRAVGRILCVLTVCFALAYMIYGQVELTELTDQIGAATNQLEEARSVEVQLQYAAGSSMTAAEIEEYAASVLGMQKVDPGQITYIELASGNGGTVVQALARPWYRQLWDSLLSLLA